MMTTKDIQALLIVISQTLAAIKEFPVFEEVIEDDSYYTMSGLTIGDAIQALDEVAQEAARQDGHEFRGGCDG
ncbi:MULTISPECIES: hypothetical protein [unclassified Microcoleus]|uniref:hypothetical protein n=1 Tax=unclassified Microcoleus TaxID=2642155 RepID=UPI002FD6750C